MRTAGACFICAGKFVRLIQRSRAGSVFDHWLTGNGWTYTGSSFDRNPVLPESRFPKPGLWRHYRRIAIANEAVVEVWPIDSVTGSFNVVLTTERPSWARRLWNALD
jgi:hypothetical protein